MDQDVGVGDNAIQQVHPLGLEDVQRYAEFVGIQVEEQAALFGMGFVFGIRTAPAGAVADTRTLDLNHVGAEVSKQFGGVGRGGQLADFNNFNARKWAAHVLDFTPTYSGKTLRNGLTSTFSNTPRVT